MSIEKKNENNREIDRLVEYFKFYDGIEPIQNPNEINADGQFKTLAVSLNERLCKHTEGTIIDIGCGHGALLEALCGMKSFETSKWFYIGTDKEENIDIVRKLAFDKKVNRRVELVSLDEFYSKAVTDFDTPQPYKFICRNVLHELSIQETAVIVQYWCLNMRDGELFLQDLLSFKNGERGNVCWSRNELENVLKELGFNSAIYDFTGKDNVKWLTGIISFDSDCKITLEKIKEIIKQARLRQFNEYINDFSEKNTERIDIINKDLQLASLCHLLFEEGLEIALPKRENSYAMTIFQVALEQFNFLKSATNILPATPNFRDRAKPQDWLQENITSEGNRCYVYGGRKIGKTYLINYVLERRSYERTVITTTLTKTSTVWSLIEQLLEKVNIRIRTEILSHMKDIGYSSIKNDLLSFLNRYGESFILVIENFDNILDHNNCIINAELKEFVKDLISSKLFSIIFEARLLCEESFFEEINNRNSFNLLRFPEDIHVVNILDDYIQKSAIGLANYPDSLLEAIGRHPFMTYLAAKIISKLGIQVLEDGLFLHQLERQLQQELINRLVDEKNEQAMRILLLLRIPTPKHVLETICDSSSLQMCINDGLVISHYIHFGVECLFPVSKIELYSYEDAYDEVENDPLNCSNLAFAYFELYKTTENPIWLREFIFFSACSRSNPEWIVRYGKVYLGEILGAAMYWYQKRDYKNALWAYSTAQQLDDDSLDTKIKIASCKVRTHQSNACKEFEELIAVTNNYSCKTTYIDALLSIKEYAHAYKKLVEYFPGEDRNYWVLRQYGLAHFGLNQYEKASNKLEISLQTKKQDYLYIKLSTAYYLLGDFASEIETLEKARRYFPKSIKITIKLATAHMRQNNSDSLEKWWKIIENLYERYPLSIDVILVYCKFLCRKDRESDAIEIFRSFNAKTEEEIFKKNLIEIDILVATKQWDYCIKKICSSKLEKRYEVGLLKKVYLYWYNEERDPHIAFQGLQIEVPKNLENIVPIRITNYSLAIASNDDESIEQEKSYLSKIYSNAIKLKYWDSCIENIAENLYEN